MAHLAPVGRRNFLALGLGGLLVAPLARAWAEDRDGWLGPYPPLAVLEDRIAALAASRPDLVGLEPIGQSVEGRPLTAVRVGRRDGRTRPEALYAANLHAGEVIAAMVAMGTLARLIEDDGADPWITSLVDRIDLWIIPTLNPDGYHRVISTAGKGGELGTRKNQDGVDLNRNFPLVPGAHSRHPLAGNKRPRSSYYMGDHPLSEPETRALADLAARRRFFVSFMGHSAAGKVLYPHCFANVSPNHLDLFQRIGAAYVQAQPHQKYKVQQSYSWYPTLGDADDFLYINHGVLAHTVEHGTMSHNILANRDRPRLFWTMNPYDLQAWVENDRDAVLHAIETAFDLTGGDPRDPNDCVPNR